MQLLPADVVKQIGKRHPLLIPPFTNDTLRRAVHDYLAGGARKEDIVKKYGEINNWDVSKVTDMEGMFDGAESFNQPLNKWNVSNVENMFQMFKGATSFRTGRVTALVAALWVLWVWEADVDSPESSQEHLLPVKRAEPSSTPQLTVF